MIGKNLFHFIEQRRHPPSFQKKYQSNQSRPPHFRPGSLHQRGIRGISRLISFGKTEQIEGLQHKTQHSAIHYKNILGSPQLNCKNLQISLLNGIDDNKENDDEFTSQKPKRKAFLILGSSNSELSYSRTSLLTELKSQSSKKEELRRMKKSISLIQKIALQSLSKIDCKKRLDTQKVMLRKKCVKRFHHKNFSDYPIIKKTQNRASFGGISLMKQIEKQVQSKDSKHSPKSKYQKLEKINREKEEMEYCIREHSSEDDLSNQSSSQIESNERKLIIHKLKNLTNQCFKLETETKLRKTMTLFGQYSKEMGDRLQEKERRLEKICASGSI